MENLTISSIVMAKNKASKISKNRRKKATKIFFSHLLKIKPEKMQNHSTVSNPYLPVFKISSKSICMKNNSQIIESFQPFPAHNQLVSSAENTKKSPPIILPDAEPSIPDGGFKYTLVQPFLPQGLKDNVMHAIEFGHISSFGIWPKNMSEKLKDLYEYPVAQPCSSGFTALVLALQTANISEGDEVIIPSFTFIAVANAVHFVRATPVFADSSEDNYNPSWENIDKVSSGKTKAIIMTHTYGVPAPDIEGIADECRSRGWWLIEDVSQCVGVRTKSSKLLGTFGDFTCASMFLSKMIHGGDGGFVLARQERYASRLASLVNHGFIQGLYYVHVEPAINGKINALGAAMACGCLDELENVIRNRTQVSQNYRDLVNRFQDKSPAPDERISCMPLCGPEDSPWVFGVHCTNMAQRTRLRRILAINAIETRDFFFPLHLQPAYLHLNSKARCNYPNAEKFGFNGFYLPTHFGLKINDQESICSILQKAMSN